MKRRDFLASSALLALFTGPVRARANLTPWRNWSGHLFCEPSGRYSPSSVEDLASFLKTFDGPVRPVGSGHSFSPLVPTNGHLVVLDQLTSLIEHSNDNLTAKCGNHGRGGGPMGQYGGTKNNPHNRQREIDP